jgi:TolB-like protein/Tfp pilus assembly protein PilF
MRPLVLAIAGAALVVAALAVWKLWPRPAIDSIAVLPFVNATNDADLDYLSDGIAESVMVNLSQIPTLKVMSRNSVFRYKGRSSVDPKQVARELGVRAVLLGTMRQQGEQLRVSIELVDARDERQLWGAEFERPRGEVIQIEQEISQQASAKLRLRLTGEQQKHLVRQRVPSPEAYDLYLRGRHALQERSNAEIQRGLEFLQKAIDADPAYADAYVEMSAAYGLLAFYGGMEPKQAFLREEAAIRRAAELAPDSARVHLELGYLLLNLHRDFKGTEREWKRALEVEPNSGDVHHAYSVFLANRGRFDEALREAYLYEQLDPLWRGARNTTSWILFYARRYDEAGQHALNSGSGFSPSYWMLGQVYEQQGRYREAIEAFRQDFRLAGRGDFSQASLAHAYALAGRKAEAQALLVDMLELHRTSYYSPVNIAAVYLGLGDQSSALRWLNVAIEQRDPWLDRLEVEPRFDPLRKVPEFTAIVQKVNTPD